ncbi:MAG TPA: hypothetical protein VMC04_04830 [Verrucomicrobiae bacterium]|jgi:hypothetical protein|nr:hypothetical protein [Methylomirabilota bacterium]HTI53533.1 hypothetical protein [Verrucomicrobiae bacterium]
MKLEVEVVQEEGGLYRASAVLYPDVSVTGRTEKEALGLLLEAVAKYLRSQPERA